MEDRCTTRFRVVRQPAPHHTLSNDDEHLRSGLFHPAADPRHLDAGLRLTVLRSMQQFVVARTLRALCHPLARSRWIALYDVDRATDAERAAFLDHVGQRLTRL